MLMETIKGAPGRGLGMKELRQKESCLNTFMPEENND